MSRRLATGFALGLLLLLLGAAPASAAAPDLAVYVTDADEDVYVALYGDAAVELVDCEGAPAARALLQLPATAAAAETTLAELETRFGLGAHPAIPCGPEARFDLAWPATTPIWADLGGSGNYFLPAPDGGGRFYAVPSRCVGLKAALAIRERLQLPGVLQGLAAPEEPGDPLLLDCGDGDDGGENGAPAPAPEARLSLHTFDTFLSADSTGDTIYVARYRPTAADAPPVYLPIWRTDGRGVPETVLAGGELAAATETALKDLFGLPPTAPVTRLGAEAVAAVRAAVHVDLCLAECEGYAHRHAAFASPGIDLGLTELAEGGVAERLGRRGDRQLAWEFLGGREAVFTGCDRVAAALGLPAPAAAEWLPSVEAALLAAPGEGAAFTCQRGPTDTCLRRVADGAPLTQAIFAAGADCRGARRLRVELPAAVQAPAPLALSGADFESIEVAPQAGVPRSVVTVRAGRPAVGTTACILSSAATLVLADGLPRLELRSVSLRRAEDGSDDEVVAIQVQDGALVLDDALLGGDAEGTRPVARGVTLCLADLYAVDSSIAASSLGVQGISARILLAGAPEAPALVAEPRYGLLASADSTLRLHHARIVARTPLVLRGGRAVASRSELAPGTGAASDSSALLLERTATAELTTSTASGFRCVASFTDAASRASFLLPGNDLARDNTHLACGAPGQFTLLE